jgi:uncharacterized protein YndB with AHSA1/START domain
METILNNDITKEKNILESSPLVTISRILNAPIEQVWKSWSKEELIKKWWGPEGFTCPTAKIDFREGGKYLLGMQDSSGKIIWSSGIYKEIVPNKKIVSTDHFSDEFGNPIFASAAGMPGEWPLDCIITVEFSNDNVKQTKMIINHEGIPKEMHDDCVEGWNSSINKLQKLLERH